MSTPLLTSPPAPLTSKIALSELDRMKRHGEKIAAITAYDAPSGRLADLAGIDCVHAIDWVFVKDGMRRDGYTVRVDAASDHYPLVANVSRR